MTDLLDASAVPDALRDVADGAARLVPGTIDRLRELVAVPSVSMDGHDTPGCLQGAEVTERILRDAGLPEVRQLHVDGAPPFVFARSDEAPDAPTVLLYAHYDVQPIPNLHEWTTHPFEPDERDGRLYGRGTSDNKAGITVHAGAVEAWMQTRKRLPLNVKVIIEGEEEVGSQHMPAMLADHAELLRADVLVICDSVNRDTGRPAITYTTRGIAEVYVTVRALKTSIHSGASGPIPDALSGLIVTLASLKDERGGSAVPGLEDDARVPTAAEIDRIRALESTGPGTFDASLLEGVQMTGDDGLSIRERQWTKPAITVLGLDVPRVGEATNQLLSEARAKVSVRLAPGQDPQRVMRLVAGHLERHTPWGLHCETVLGAGAYGWVTEPAGPVFEAAERALSAGFGRTPAIVGIGGTLPLLTQFEETFPGIVCLMTAVADPKCRAHGTDESVELADVAKAMLSEALLLDELSRV